MAVLVEAYFGMIPDAFRRPNNLLYQWLDREIANRGVRGIIFRSYVWCDIWNAEAQRTKEWSQVPLLAIVSYGSKETDGHIASRLEAFLEMLR